MTCPHCGGRKDRCADGGIWEWVASNPPGIRRMRHPRTQLIHRLGAGEFPELFLREEALVDALFLEVPALRSSHQCASLSIAQQWKQRRGGGCAILQMAAAPLLV